MGCTSNSNESEAEWRAKTERYEANFLHCIGWKDGEYIAKYTTIQKKI